MKEVYYLSCGGLYLCGKVRKEYKINDTFKLKWTICKLRVIKVLDNEIHVIPA